LNVLENPLLPNANSTMTIAQTPDAVHPDARGKYSHRLWLRTVALLGALTILLAVLFGAVRPWYQHWGSTPSEIGARLPGDDLGFPGRTETRAIGIRAAAPDVFAWVAQLGQTRGGFYSFDLLEDLIGCEMPRIERLDPALQRWTPGDKLWMYPPAKLSGSGFATLIEYEQDRALVFGTRAPGAGPTDAISGTWSFVVEPLGEHASRLVVRGTGGAAPSLLGAAFQRTVFEPIHFAMERRMLEGIATLAEGKHPPSRLADAAQLTLWALSFSALIGFAVAVLVRDHWQRALVAFALAGIVFQVLTFLQPALWVGGILVAALFPFLEIRTHPDAS
jgi:hypothetical protein